MTQIALVTYPGFTALDLIGPYEVLQHLPGSEVRFVWHEIGPVAADSGRVVLAATHTLNETESPDIIVVPGGTASVMVHAQDRALLEWLQRSADKSAVITSVCAGSVILGAAGLLEGRRATSHWQTLGLLKGFGAEPVADERFVDDGAVVTSAGVSAGIDMALWLASRLSDQSRAEAIQLAIEYDPEPPFDCGSKAKADTRTAAAANLMLARQGMSLPHLRAGAAIGWKQAITRSRRRPRTAWRASSR